MSIKHVREYYDKITKDYMDMVETLKDMEELASQKVVNPDKVDEVKRLVEPLKVNWERISYIIFLLNQPTRKEKADRYKKQNNKFLSKCDLSEHDENLRILSELNSSILDGESDGRTENI